MDQLLAWIYPNRLLVAVTLVLAATAFAVIAWRLGWHRFAARHRLITGIAIVVALAIAAPATWYLGSPLFIRTELVESPPVAVVQTATPSALSSAPSPSATATARPTTPPLTLSGTFVGADDFHFTKGTARIVETEPGRLTLRLEKFSVRNGPDLYVYVSPDSKGYAKGAVEVGRLKATDGSFNYELPPGTSRDNLASVVIWCKAFSVQFGHAALS
jgi:hypothetical protein